MKAIIIGVCDQVKQSSEQRTSDQVHNKNLKIYLVTMYSAIAEEVPYHVSVSFPEPLKLGQQTPAE